jgi:hypothetical protein
MGDLIILNNIEKSLAKGFKIFISTGESPIINKTEITGLTTNGFRV